MNVKCERERERETWPINPAKAVGSCLLVVAVEHADVDNVIGIGRSESNYLQLQGGWLPLPQYLVITSAANM
jgi:hypothetical protein